jgi:hypothetical protein
MLGNRGISQPLKEADHEQDLTNLQALGPDLGLQLPFAEFLNISVP